MELALPCPQNFNHFHFSKTAMNSLTKHHYVALVFITTLVVAALPLAAQKQSQNKVTAHEQHTKSHEEQMSAMFDKPKVNIKTVGIFVYDNFSPLDAMGPYQVLSEMMGVKVFFISRDKSKNNGIVQNTAGMKMQVDVDISDVDSLDILVIPGGLTETYLLTQDSVLLAWIRKIDKTTKYTTSVCTGAWILGATGLLKGKNATTHWYGKEILAKDFGAKVNMSKTERWVRDGKYWTSAGVTAGMDMSLAIVKEIMGEKYTKTAMLDLEYDPKPPFQGGSEYNTDKALVEMMRSMYDGGIKPLRDSLQQSLQQRTK